MLLHLYWPFEFLKPTIIEKLDDGKILSVPYEIVMCRSGAAFIRPGKSETRTIVVLETSQSLNLDAPASPWVFQKNPDETSIFSPDVQRAASLLPMSELFLGLMLFTEGVPHMPRWKEILAKLQQDTSFAGRLYKDVVQKFINSKPAHDVSVLQGRMLCLMKSPVFYRLFDEYHQGRL